MCLLTDREWSSSLHHHLIDCCFQLLIRLALNLHLNQIVSERDTFRTKGQQQNGKVPSRGSQQGQGWGKKKKLPSKLSRPNTMPSESGRDSSHGTLRSLCSTLMGACACACARECLCEHTTETKNKSQATSTAPTICPCYLSGRLLFCEPRLILHTRTVSIAQ